MPGSKKHKFDTHFTDRWRERGDPAADPYVLRKVLTLEYLKIRKGEESAILSRVMDDVHNPDVEYLRFFISGVPFYVAMSKFRQVPITCYTQAMMRRKRRARSRFKKKYRSERGKLGNKARAKYKGQH